MTDLPLAGDINVNDPFGSPIDRPLRITRPSSPVNLNRDLPLLEVMMSMEDLLEANLLLSNSTGSIALPVQPVLQFGSPMIMTFSSSAVRERMNSRSACTSSTGPRYTHARRKTRLALVTRAVISLLEACVTRHVILLSTSSASPPAGLPLPGPASALTRVIEYFSASWEVIQLLLRDHVSERKRIWKGIRILTSFRKFCIPWQFSDFMISFLD